MIRPTTQKWVYIFLLVLGIVAFLLCGVIAIPILRQDEGLGMVVAFGPALLLFLLFLPASLAAFVLSLIGFARGPISLQGHILLWYVCAAVFGWQMARLDRLAGVDAFPLGTVILFVTFGAALFVLPVLWLWIRRTELSGGGHSAEPQP